LVPFQGNFKVDAVAPLTSKVFISMKAERQAYLLLAAVIVLWGANWPIMKVGLDYIPPLWFASVRLLLGAFCLFLLIGVKGQLSLPDRRDMPVLLSVGCLQLGLALALIHIALTEIEASRSAILAYTVPLWVTPLAIIVLGEKIGLAKTLGLALGLAGIAVLFNPADFDFTNTTQLIGNGYLIASAMLGAIVITHVRNHRMVMSTLQIMPWQMLIGGTLLAMTALIQDGVPNLEFSGPLIAVLAYNGPVASAFCFWAYQTVMRSLPATSTSLGSLGVPVAGMVFSAIALGEPLSMGKIGGLMLISSGVVALIAGDFFWRSKSKA